MFCKLNHYFFFPFANTLHLKSIISLQSVIGHKTEKNPLPVIATRRGYAPGRSRLRLSESRTMLASVLPSVSRLDRRSWLQRKPKDQVCFLRTRVADHLSEDGYRERVRHFDFLRGFQ